MSQGESFLAGNSADYNHFEGSKQRWRDLVGYYTRFGDVP